TCTATGNRQRSWALPSVSAAGSNVPIVAEGVETKEHWASWGARLQWGARLSNRKAADHRCLCRNCRALAAGEREWRLAGQCGRRRAYTMWYRPLGKAGRSGAELSRRSTDVVAFLSKSADELPLGTCLIIDISEDGAPLRIGK